MTINMDEEKRRRRALAFVKAYPVGLLLIAVALNLIVFGVKPMEVALPAVDGIRALVIAAVLLVINHTWLITTTELTRVRFGMFATPEEWIASGTRSQDAPVEGLLEMDRRHNIHRNTTENAVYFIMLAAILVLVSPVILASSAWIVLFPLARLGYTYSYLTGRDGSRGLFMSLSLLAMYGIASYLVISLVI